MWPGNSTNILKLRWPEAELIGLDDSEAMIQQAKEKYKDIKWVLADATGDLSSLGTFDIVFSNAAIQWIPNHPALIKNMFKLLNKGGVLAVQVPYTEEMPIHTDLQKLITRPKWRDFFVGLRLDTAPMNLPTIMTS